MLDPDTRSVEVLIECDNSTRLMKPEMYGTVKLSDREAEVIRIPNFRYLAGRGEHVRIGGIGE